MFTRYAIALAVAVSAWSGPVAATDDGWSFVWVSSGIGGYDVVSGRGKVTMENGSLTAELQDERMVGYTLSGNISGHRVRAKFSVIGSGYFINSPFSGSYLKKRWSGMADSAGRESITLTDGWNFIGLSREIRP